MSAAVTVHIGPTRTVGPHCFPQTPTCTYRRIRNVDLSIHAPCACQTKPSDWLLSLYTDYLHQTAGAGPENSRHNAPPAQRPALFEHVSAQSALTYSFPWSPCLSTVELSVHWTWYTKISMHNTFIRDAFGYQLGQVPQLAFHNIISASLALVSWH